MARRRDARRPFEIAEGTLAAVHRGRNDLNLLEAQANVDDGRGPQRSDQPHPALGPTGTNRLGEGFRRAHGIEHHVVAAGRPDRTAQPFDGGPLVVVASAHIGDQACGVARRHQCEPDGPGADDGDPVTHRCTRTVQPVNRHRERLDDGGGRQVDPDGQRMETRCGNHQLFGHATVVEDSEGHHRVAVVGVPVLAVIAVPAPADRFDRNRPAVRSAAGQLVAEDAALGEAVVDEVQIRAADAGRHDIDEHAVAGGRGRIDDGRCPVDDADCFHSVSSCWWRNGWLP